MAGSRCSPTEGAVVLIYLETLCAEFHVLYTDLSMEPITAAN